MKEVAIFFALFGLMSSPLTQNDLGVKKEKGGPAETSNVCSGESHIHRYSDMRLAVVVVRSADSCGFSFSDIEDNTIGPDNRFEFAHDFKVMRTEDKNRSEYAVRTDILPRSFIKQGVTGIVFYCSRCRTVLSFKLYDGEDEVSEK